MKYKTIFACVILLSGCEGFIDKMLDQNSETFNASYKESFVDACVEPENTDEKRQICSCLADELIDNHTPSELLDHKRAEKYIGDVAIHQCIEGTKAETEVLTEFDTEKAGEEKVLASKAIK